MKRRLLRFWWMAGSLIFLAPTAARAGNVKEELGELVESLLSSASLKDRRMAVGDFADSERGATVLGESLALEIESQIVSRAKGLGATVVSRRNMGAVLKEWDLNVNSYVNEDTAPQVGKLVGAQVMCLGTYSLNKKNIQLKASLVAVEGGEILGTASAEFKLAKNLLAQAQQPVRRTDLTSEAAKQGGQGAQGAAEGEPPAPVPEEGLKVELWADKESVRIGEKIAIHARANQDCYLTLIDVGTSGSAAVIFPNSFTQSNAIKAGVTYSIPDSAAGFDFEAGGPPGTELIRAIASKTPAVDLKDAMDSFSAQSPFAAVRRELPILTRDIRVKAKKAAKGDWSEAVLKLTLVR